MKNISEKLCCRMSHTNNGNKTTTGNSDINQNLPMLVFCWAKIKLLDEFRKTNSYFSLCYTLIDRAAAFSMTIN